jgi:hypothetical protein
MEQGVTGYRVDAQSVDSMQLDGEAVLLNLATHRYFGLNATATDVWEWIKTNPGVSASQVASALGQRYGRASNEVIDDVTALLEQMASQRLVDSCPPVLSLTLNATLNGRPYMAPALQVFGDLDTLILSGE